MYHSWLNSFYGTSFFNLYSCILCILIFIILNNVDTLRTIYFYVCRWNLKKRKTIKVVNKTFGQITQLMQVDRALIRVPTKNDRSIFIFYVNASWCIFWNISLWKVDILYNVLNIVSKLKDNGLPITVTITWMLTFWLFLCLCCPILYDKGTPIDI